MNTWKEFKKRKADYMLEHLKKEMNSFLNDVNQNIKDQNDLIYIKERTSKLLDVMMEEVEKLVDYKEEKLNAIVKKQREEEIKLQELREKIDTIYEDIYEEEDDSFSISCPYCNHEFDAEIDEEFHEIRCPECGNLIELDWNGNPDDEQDSGCGGNCSNCGGC